MLCRHGQTEANQEQLILGQQDSNLTPTGRDQVRTLALVLARLLPPSKNPGRIITSPLGRGLATAAIFSQALNWPVVEHNGLRELSAGVWEGRPRNEVLAAGQDLRGDWSDHPPGGESYAAAEARVGAVLKVIEQTKGPVLLVGHAGLNRVVLRQFMGLEPEKALGLRFPHATAYLFDELRNIYRVDGNGVVESGLLRSDPGCMKASA